MNKPEKLSLIVGGSIIGGLALGFAGYKWYKNKQTEEVAPINTDYSDSDNEDYAEQINAARGTPSSDTKKPNNLPTDPFDDDDDTISITSTLDGGKKKKTNKKKTNKSKTKRCLNKVKRSRRRTRRF